MKAHPHVGGLGMRVPCALRLGPCVFLWTALLCASAGAHVDVTEISKASEAANPESAGQWRINAVPRFSFSNDEGVGVGIRGTAYWHRWGARPYKTAISFQAFATSRWVQQHLLRVDALDAFALPLRISAEVGYYQSRTFTFCGLGGSATCDAPIGAPPASGSLEAGPNALDGAERYHQVRFMEPYGNVTLRWRLGNKPHLPELIAGWRGQYQQPGEFADENRDGAPDFFPYPGSLYSKSHPSGERGLVSVLQIGASLDNRDEEPDPSRGYLLEIAARGAHPYWGSDWSHVGLHATARLYLSLISEKRLVWASRYVLDSIFGDAPLAELSRVGGLSSYFAYGGSDMGRGIRQQRFPGRQKVMIQHELRSRWAELTVLSQNFQFSTAVFGDAGWVLERDVFAGEPWRLHLGFGAGLRIVWNQNFVMRVDFGFSPVEGGQPYLYTKPDHPF